MTYKHTVTRTLPSRPDRFITHVDANGRTVICHVKNTRRYRELLIPGVTVTLECHPEASVTGRKIEYDLIGVYKGNVLVNVDPQTPNGAAWEQLEATKDRTFPEPSTDPGDAVRTPDNIRKEVIHGDSRFDLAFTLDHMDGKSQIPAFVEVRGVTLKDHGIAVFPDAPALRGIKHLHGLTQAVREGYDIYVLFVIRMGGIRRFKPSSITHPTFGEALREASSGGVHVLTCDCIITPDTMAVDQPVPVSLDWKEGFRSPRSPRIPKILSCLRF